MNLRKWIESPFVGGIISSIIASFLLALGAWLWDAEIWLYPVPLWLLVLVTACLIGVGVALIRQRPLNRRRIFVIMSAFQKKQFFADVLQNMLTDFALHDLDVVVKIPQRDYSPYYQNLHFKEILSKKHNYLGGIVVPVEPQNRKKEITDFANNFGKPIVFLDVQPYQSESEYPPNTCYVGFNSAAGGERAAEEMARTLRKRGVSSPRVLVIGSNIQKGRQNSFIERFKQLMPNSDVLLNEEGYFLREEARKIATHYFQEIDKNNKPLDGIFCTNDEMALGVTEALPVLRKELIQKVTIIGFDGIREAIMMIERGNTPVKNTVVQNIEELAEQSVSALVKMMADEAAPKVTLLSPKLHQNIQDA